MAVRAYVDVDTRIKEIVGIASAHGVFDGTASSLADVGQFIIIRLEWMRRIDGAIGVGDEEPASIRRRLGEAVLPYLPEGVANRLKLKVKKIATETW